MSDDAFSSIADGHENRIQKVEEKVSEVAASIAGLDAKQDALSEKLDSNQTAVIEKFDQGIKWLNGRTDDILAECKDQTSKIDGFHARIAPLETLHKQSEERRALTRKIMISAILAASGVLGTKLFEIVLEFFKR